MKKLIFLLIAVFLVAITPEVLPQDEKKAINDSIENVKLKARADSLEKVLNEQSQHLEKEKTKDKWIRVAYAGTAFVFISGVLWLLLAVAYKSRKMMLDRADENGDIMEVTSFLMRQSLGLPQGSLRGIIAIVVAASFISAIFFYGTMEEIPDAFKIVVSLVFGYYFSKSENQTKEVIDAMLGKTKQLAVKKQEANFAISEARNANAESYAPDLFTQAIGKFNSAENESKAGEAIKLYNKAIDLARQAKTKAIENKRIKNEEENDKNSRNYNNFSRQIYSRVGDLKAIKTNEHIVKGLEDNIANADTQAHAKNFEDAIATLERVKERIDTLLLEYDEAEKLYSNIQEDKRNTIEDNLEDALSGFNTTFVNDIPGDNEKLIESIVRMQAQVKDKGEKLLPALRKRFLGIEIDESDIRDIVRDIKNRGDKSFFKALFETAAIKAKTKLTDALREKIEIPEFVEKLLLGEKEEKNKLFKEDFKPNGIKDDNDFKKLIGKVKNGLVDAALGDSIKQALPEGIDFDSVKSLLKGAQQDKDGKSVSSRVEKILDVGETILGYTPIGGAAKIAGTVIRGIFKLFGRKKRKQR